MRTITKIGSAVAVAASVATLTVAPAAHAGDRTSTSGVGVAASPCWQSGGRWWCNNRYAAPVYERGPAPGVIGYMYSTTSFFVCRKEGEWNNNGPHPNRWVWTQADNGRWGWMRDSDISSETNPLPGLPCPR